ncbi:hypothetical protein F5Y01DRAFT_243600 [Xylaria sp. FL0043]|nr:hypothetical protein F5Y01DRAFT_243600 [Xylaria sp. FL0043]
MPETLREKASKKIKGPDANPSQLGDPISVKAEDSDTVPTKDEAGASSPSTSSSSSSSSSKSQNGNSSSRGGETLREKAAKKLNGPDANPSQLGDPISLKNETSPGVPVDSERGADEDEKVVKRDSKL